jgi:hypothetical protein
MITYQITSTIIGIAIASAIFWLVRRDHLHGSYAIWWIGAAIMVVILGFLPRSFDYLAIYLGINYPPVLAIVVALGLLLIKMLTMDLERSRQERLIRRLAQRLAMLEARSPLPSQPNRAPETYPYSQTIRLQSQESELDDGDYAQTQADLSTSIAPGVNQDESLNQSDIVKPDTAQQP